LKLLIFTIQEPDDKWRWFGHLWPDAPLKEFLADPLPLIPKASSAIEQPLTVQASFMICPQKADFICVGQIASCVSGYPKRFR
jgi:hypothetical protein